MAAKIRVAIVEDHPLVMQAVRQQFQAEVDAALVLEISHGSRLLTELRRQRVDVVLLDLGMDVGVFDPVTTLRRMRQLYPEIRVVVISSLSYGEVVVGVLRVGVDGYLAKNDLVSRDLVQVVRRVVAGEKVYSPEIEELQVMVLGVEQEEAMLDVSERELLYLAAQGHTNRQIGFLLGYSEKTVRNRFTPIYRKLGAANRVDAIRRAETMGLLARGPHGY